MVALKEQDWAAWNRAMIATHGILDYSRAAIMHCVRTTPENIHLTAGALQQHINKTLTETDHANPLPEIVAIACGQQTINQGTNEDEAQPNRTRKMKATYWLMQRSKLEQCNRIQTRRMEQRRAWRMYRL